jgi:hypothetical protein
VNTDRYQDLLTKYEDTIHFVNYGENHEDYFRIPEDTEVIAEKKEIKLKWIG